MAGGFGGEMMWGVSQPGSRLGGDSSSGVSGHDLGGPQYAYLNRPQAQGTWQSQGYDPYKNALWSQLGSMGGAALAPPPRIDAGPIWNSQQIQGRVNSMNASNNARAATSTRNIGQNLSARGFGGNSPLAQALGMQANGQALAANTQGENDIRWNAAQGNADHVLNAQLGRSNQWNQQNEQAIANRGMELQNRYQLLNMLSNLS